MDFTPGLRGLLLGFAIAMPVGPIGVLCIRRTLAFGRLPGFMTGLGAATADGVYGGIAAFGMTAVTSVLAAQSVWIRLAGAALLCFLGWRALRSAPPAAPASVTSISLRGAWASTVVLTLTNPATIVSFSAAFATLGIAGAHGGAAAPALTTLGVFTGSALWWFVLSSGISALRRRLTTSALRWINRLSGAVLIAFSVGAVLSVLA